MPDPSTTRLALYKSKSDGSETVSYTQDIGQNLDKLDAAAGFASCTSSTRPSSPYSGKPIFETDTSYRTYFSNGTSPASASWVEIPNGSAQYNSTLRLASGKQLNVNGSASSATIAVVNAATTTDLLSARVSGDTQDRFLIDTDGTLNWGAGASAAPDVNLYRSTANTLRTADNFTVDLALSVAGNVTVGSSTAVLNATSGVFTTYANNAVTTYTPTVTGWGSTTFSTRTGWYVKIGKMVYVNIKLMTSGAGSGSANCQVDLPSIPNTVQDQLLLMRWQENEIGYAISFSASATATMDRLRVQDGSTAGKVNNLIGSMVGSGQNVNIQGWYLEA